MCLSPTIFSLTFKLLLALNVLIPIYFNLHYSTPYPLLVGTMPGTKKTKLEQLQREAATIVGSRAENPAGWLDPDDPGSTVSTS
jgi:hypothetical protein